MPLPLTISCSSKSRLVLTFLVLPFWYLLTRVVQDIFQKSSKMVVCCLFHSSHKMKTFSTWWAGYYCCKTDCMCATYTSDRARCLWCVAVMGVSDLLNSRIPVVVVVVGPVRISLVHFMWIPDASVHITRASTEGWTQVVSSLTQEEFPLWRGGGNLQYEDMGHV